MAFIQAYTPAGFSSTSYPNAFWDCVQINYNPMTGIGQAIYQVWETQADHDAKGTPLPFRDARKIYAFTAINTPFPSGQALSGSPQQVMDAFAQATNDVIVTPAVISNGVVTTPAVTVSFFANATLVAPNIVATPSNPAQPVLANP